MKFLNNRNIGNKSYPRGRTNYYSVFICTPESSLRWAESRPRGSQQLPSQLCSVCEPGLALHTRSLWCLALVDGGYTACEYLKYDAMARPSPPI